MPLVCTICKNEFSKSFNLKRHLLKIHAVTDKLDELLTKKEYKKCTVCKECQATFVNKSNLTRHIKEKHRDIIDRLIKPKKYECEECKKHFMHKNNLEKHKKIHNSEKVVKKRMQKCCLCDFEDISRGHLINHFKKYHDITIKVEKLEFSNIESFTFWKNEIEKKTNVSFTSQHGSYNTTNRKIVTFTCHRSGYYKSKGSGVRRLKTQCTSKINGLCPARLKVEISTDGKCIVEFVKTHVGHDCSDLGHLHLSKVEREALATKIAAKIPFQSILDEFRGPMNATKLERTHLLTKKDLYNIQQCFNLNNEASRHKNKAVSVNCRENLKQKVNNIIDSITTQEEFDAIEKLTASFQPTLDAIRSQRDIHLQTKVPLSVSHNKNIVPRIRNYKAKKDTIKKQIIQLIQPENVEILELIFE